MTYDFTYPEALQLEAEANPPPLLRDTPMHRVDWLLIGMTCAVGVIVGFCLRAWMGVL